LNWTKREINNSKRIAELGERKEIGHGDWYLNKKVDIPCLWKSTPPFEYKHINIIPLWDWHDCREWLKKREYRLFQLHEEFVTRDMKICLCGKTSDYHIEIIGKTDTEAIQKCVIKVLEKEKGGLG